MARPIMSNPVSRLFSSTQSIYLVSIALSIVLTLLLEAVNAGMLKLLIFGFCSISYALSTYMRISSSEVVKCEPLTTYPGEIRYSAIFVT